MQLPDFSSLDPAEIPADLAVLLDANRAELKQLLAAESEPGWENTLGCLDTMENRIDHFWSPVSHLNAVCNSDPLREAYEACIALLTAYHTELGQNRALYQRIQSLAEGASIDDLGQARFRTLQNTLRDFVLSGVALEGEQRERFKAIRQRLSELGSSFSNHVLDDTESRVWLESDLSRLAGLPDSAQQRFKEAAASIAGVEAKLSLDGPTYLNVMQYAQDRGLRREFYLAWGQRASEFSADTGHDNGPVMLEILALREEQAKLLGFEHYAALSVATKMVPDTDTVLSFLHRLAQKSRPRAIQEFAELQAFAAEQGCDSMQPWDVAFYSELLRRQRYDLSQEVLRPWFPAASVLQGLFGIAGDLFGVEFEPMSADVWHQDVQVYALRREGEIVAACYLDLYARQGKRGGAWMADFCRRWRQPDEALQLPVAFLTCNFEPAADDRPALLTHNEVITLFHEFGHGLHHMLTEVEVLGVSGISGVEWDAVELPSQFLENWCWQAEGLARFARHFETGEPLPGELLEKLLAARNFQSAMQMCRQLEFALFDFCLHSAAAPQSLADLMQGLAEIREQVAVYPVPADQRFPNSFSHIFAGGYAAGYYSYKWAEVLSADAFSLFEERGVMDQDTGRAFLNNILARGGSEAPLALFERFRGRPPSEEALLRHSGIADVAA